MLQHAVERCSMFQRVAIGTTLADSYIPTLLGTLLP